MRCPIEGCLSTHLTQFRRGFVLVKDAIDVRTGRGLVPRVLHDMEDVQVIEKMLRYVSTLIEEFKVCDEFTYLQPGLYSHR